ncbi:MAG: hypothetical protein V2I74_03535 [Erythrobacter sp.]|jgi:hypothetical protein|nr:hypothetical protein [Erythrobacter sp.]
MNTTLKLFPVLLLILLMGCNVTGCGVSNTEPFVDAEKDEQGNVRILDTPRMWQDWQADVDRAIAKEVNGEPPGGGIKSWSVQWQRVIRANQDRENAQKYINYIFVKRQEAGLPPLEVDSD